MPRGVMEGFRWGGGRLVEGFGGWVVCFSVFCFFCELLVDAYGLISMVDGVGVCFDGSWTCFLDGVCSFWLEFDEKSGGSPTKWNVPLPCHGWTCFKNTLFLRPLRGNPKQMRLQIAWCTIHLVTIIYVYIYIIYLYSILYMNSQNECLLSCKCNPFKKTARTSELQTWLQSNSQSTEESGSLCACMRNISRVQNKKVFQRATASALITCVQELSLLASRLCLFVEVTVSWTWLRGGFMRIRVLDMIRW